MATIYGNGHVLLSFFNIDYHLSINNITEELMNNPNKRFRLSLEKAPLKKTKKEKKH